MKNLHTRKFNMAQANKGISKLSVIVLMLCILDDIYRLF